MFQPNLVVVLVIEVSPVDEREGNASAGRECPRVEVRLELRLGLVPGVRLVVENPKLMAANLEYVDMASEWGREAEVGGFVGIEKNRHLDRDGR